MKAATVDACSGRSQSESSRAVADESRMDGGTGESTGKAWRIPSRVFHLVAPCVDASLCRRNGLAASLARRCCKRCGNGPIWEGVWPYLDPWDVVRLRTSSTLWNGPHGELFFLPQEGALCSYKEVKMSQLTPAERREFPKSMDTEWQTLLKNQAAKVSSLEERAPARER